MMTNKLSAPFEEVFRFYIINPSCLMEGFTISLFYIHSIGAFTLNLRDPASFIYSLA